MAASNERTGFRGNDRRRRLPGPDDRRLQGLTLALIAAGTVAALAVPGPQQPTLQATAVTAAIALLALAGLAAVASWRLTGDALTLRLGGAVALLGAVALGAGTLLPLVAPELAGRALVAIRDGAAVAAIALVAVAVHGPEIDTRARLPRVLAGGLAATGATSAIFVAFPAAIVARPSLGGLSAVQVGLAVAAVALAPAAWRRGRASERPLLTWSALALLAVAAGTAADAPALFVLGALAVLIGETREVVTAYRAEAALRFEAELESAVAESRTRAVRAEHEERLHDSRSAVLAVQAATRMLEHDVEAMDPIERRRLSAAIDAELVRVRELLGGDPENTPSTCDVRQVLQPLVTCHAAAGRSLAFHVPAGIEARCRASAVSEIVQNLLDNAAVHAPGARIRLCARATGGAVEVRVSDDGPGIAPARREAVFERGTTTGGSGLGLFVSRRLAHELGGDLWVEEAARGGAEFVLRLPGGTASADDAGRAEPVDDAAQGRDVGDLDDHRGVLVRPGNPDLEHRVGA